jgi:Tol biopolymer transport system component/DNA-binding winged helix-turn-helix (wHTH) protein
MQQTSHRVYTFGDFALDLTTGSLLHNGDEVKLRPKAFETLRYLVQNPNRLISKDELVEALWTDSFVSDNSLVKCLKDVRAALNDEAHIVIKTVPRRGYIFLAQVSDAGLSDSRSVYAEQVEGIRIVIEDVEQSESTVASADQRLHVNESLPLMQTSKPHRGSFSLTKSRKATLSLGSVVLALLVGAGGYFLWTKKSLSSKTSRPTFSIENIKVTNLTTTGDVYAPVISPDGKYLAYCSGPKLYVRQMATGSIIEIPPPLPAPVWGTLHYWGIIFSADSSQIYFTIADDAENVAGTLFRVPVLGGHSQKIQNHVNSGGHESPDGNHIVFVRADQGKGLCHLMISNTDGTNEQILSTMDMNSLYGSLDWSSDNASILCAFRQHTADGYIHYIGEIPATGGAESRITPPRRERILSAHWLPDKSGLIMTAIDPETQLSQIYYVSQPAGEERRITNDLNNYRGVSIARDGRTLIAQMSNAITHLWSAPSSDPGRAVRLASSTKGSFQGVSWMPDSELVYDSYESGLMQICKMTGDGSNSQQFMTRLGHNSDPSVTPDGRFIAFCSTRSGSNQIWRMNSNGDDPVELTHSTLSVFKPQTSPDGQWVYYTADLHGNWQVRKVPIAGGDEIVVEDGPVELWAISPDGKMLAFSFADEQKKNTRIAVRRLDESEPFKYFDISPGISLQWTRDGRALSYVQPISGNANIWLQPLDGKPPRPLTALSADEWIATYAWSLDGKTLAYTRINTTFDAALMELK